MILDRKTRLLRLGVAALLGIAVVFLSVGSRSPAFHDWTHGDHVVCSLSYDPSASQAHDGNSPEGQEHEVPDPLEPFCQTGYLPVCCHQELVFFLPQIAELIGLPSSPIFPAPVSLSSLSRAPPVFI